MIDVADVNRDGGHCFAMPGSAEALPSTCRISLIVLLFLILLPSIAPAADQKLVLRSGWNLISFTVEPINPEPQVVFAPLIVQNVLEAVWTYDNGEWFAFPDTPAGQPLTVLQAGLGYWVKLKSPTNSLTNLTVNGSDMLPQGPVGLVNGWNLLGFVLDESTAYERVFSGLPVRQIWTFDAAPNVRKFRGVVFGATGTAPEPEDFVRVEPGKGYWVQLGDVGAVEPELVTGLPPDLDLPPLLPEAGADPSEQLPFAEKSPGDIDAGRDGFYDRPPSQRAVDFGDFTDLVRLTIGNRGQLSLVWRVSIDNPETTPWLRLHNPADSLCRADCPVEMTGAVTTNTAEIDVLVDRSGFGPGEYHGTLTIESNGKASASPFEPARQIDVWMTVPPLDGDYEITAHIDSVNGDAADLSNPTYYLGIYSDRDGLKGILDAQRSLLLPEYCVGGSDNGASCSVNADCGSGGRCEHHIRLAGRLYADGTNRFQISGSFELPAAPLGQAGCPNPEDDPAGGAIDNPFDVPLRRDITLRGDRPAVGATTLGPQDLQGEYFETVRNILGDPIQLRGTFVARRLSPAPTAIDDSTPSDQPSQPTIPDGDPVGVTFTKPVTENLLLSEVDVLVDISHPTPEDLGVSLESPGGKVAVLRQRGYRGPAGQVIYDATELTPDPMHGLDQYVGDLSAGTWKLKVIDYDPQPDSRGILREWELRLRGTRVNNISGTVSGVPAGTAVVLSGCGFVVQTTTNAAGQYDFTNLIDCRYKIALADPQWSATPVFVPLQGSSPALVVLTATAATNPGSPLTNCTAQSVPALCYPQDASYRFASLTTAGGAGLLYGTNGALFAVSTGPCPGPVSCFSYLADSAYFDLDRPPYNSGINGCAPASAACLSGTCCREDTNVFLRDPVTPHAIARGNNNEIDQPQPGDTSQGQKLTINIGLPVIGVSYGGPQILSIGANP